MTDTPGLNTERDERTTHRGAGWYWAWVPVVLFVVQGIVLTITIVLATGRGLNAVEPDYYARSLKWDEHAALLRAGARLGWTVDVKIGSQTGILPERAVEVSVLDRAGHPLAGAEVSVEMFHEAYAGERQTLTLEPGDGTGAYTAVASIPHVGLWELRILVERGEDRCLTVRQVELEG
ncbi:MAG: FixH family protein [Phycisphaerales bacterium]